MRAVKAAEVKGVDLSGLVAEPQVLAGDCGRRLRRAHARPVAARKHVGGTAPERVRAEIAKPGSPICGAVCRDRFNLVPLVAASRPGRAEHQE